MKKGISNTVESNNSRFAKLNSELVACYELKYSEKHDEHPLMHTTDQLHHTTEFNVRKQYSTFPRELKMRICPSVVPTNEMYGMIRSYATE